MWLYYHLYGEIPDSSSVPKDPNIKRYIDSLIGGGFDYECDPARIQSAIQRAKRNFRLDQNEKLKWFATEFFKLGEEIEKFTGNETRKLLGKLTSGHFPSR